MTYGRMNNKIKPWTWVLKTASSRFSRSSRLAADATSGAVTVTTPVTVTREGTAGGQRMSDEVLETYIKQHIQAAGGGEVFFSWHGGEPVLAGIDFYRRAVALEKRYTPPGCRIVNGIQTNATLIDDAWGRFLKRVFMWVSALTDRSGSMTGRFRTDGRGTFTSVMRGLEILRQHDVPHEVLVLSATVTCTLHLSYTGFSGTWGLSLLLSFLWWSERAGTHQK